VNENHLLLAQNVMRRTERRSNNKSRIRILTVLLCWLLGIMLFPISHSLRPTAALVLRRNVQRLPAWSYRQRAVFSSLQHLHLSRSNQPATKRWRVALSLSTSTTSAEESSNTSVIQKDEATLPASPEYEYESEHIQELTESWRDHRDINPTFSFPSWVVPVSGKSIQTILNEPLLQPYLASRFEPVQQIHPRFKLVRDAYEDIGNDTEDETTTVQKIIILHPSTPALSELPENVREILVQCQVSDGPTQSMDFSYHQFTSAYLLAKLLPVALHPPPTAFETIGHIAHLNLRALHLPYKHLIGQVLLDTLPSIETVIHKVGEVHGPYRIYDFEVLAGRPTTAVDMTEFGIQLHFDMAQVYWCSRLSEERQRLLRSEFRKDQIVADAFCGIGAMCLLAAQQLNCTIWANDWNPAAVEYLRENAARNNLNHRMGRVQCGDAYDFLTDIGLRNDGDGVQRLPDHVILNFPLESPRFLGALRWWPVMKPKRKPYKTATNSSSGSKAAGAGAGANADVIVPRVHVYTFARADPETDRSAEQVAIDLVASNLLPVADGAVKRKDELNNEHDCRVTTHPVRDVAPGKLVVCVSFSATPKLLRYMQGDFQ
jgi:tRNA (guanine37-N1)-methyltransferase